MTRIALLRNVIRRSYGADKYRSPQRPVPQSRPVWLSRSLGPCAVVAASGLNPMAAKFASRWPPTPTASKTETHSVPRQLRHRDVSRGLLPRPPMLSLSIAPFPTPPGTGVWCYQPHNASRPPGGQRLTNLRPARLAGHLRRCGPSQIGFTWIRRKPSPTLVHRSSPNDPACPGRFVTVR